MATHPTARAKKRPKARLTAPKVTILKDASSISEPRLDLAKERTITVKEAAYRLRKSEDAIRMWLRTGRLKGWQVGGTYCQVLVSEASVEEVLRTAKRFG